MRSLRIRSGRGLGDSIYLQSVVRHLLKQGKKLIALTDYPEVFEQLNCETEKFSRTNVDLLAHYTTRKSTTNTTQFQDCCINVGLKDHVELRLDWQPKNEKLLKELEAISPFVVVQMPRAPMNRTDGFGIELAPDFSKLQLAVDQIKLTHNIVQIGKGKAICEIEGVDLDMSNKGTVADLFDAATLADGFVGQCSFMNPLAESFDKPSLTIWSKRGLKSQTLYIRQITPQKIMHKENSKYVIDDQSDDVVREKVNDFLRQRQAD